MRLSYLIVVIIFAISSISAVESAWAGKKGLSKRQRQMASEDAMTETLPNDKSNVMMPMNGSVFLGIHGLIETQKYDEAVSKLKTLLPTLKDQDQIDLANFGLGIAYFHMGKYAEAKESLQKSMNQPRLLDYAHYHLGLIEKAEKNPRQAQYHFSIVRESSPNRKVLYDSLFQLGILAFEADHWQIARQHFNFLEKRIRRNPEYVDVLWNLLRVEKKLHNQARACRWARKLYSLYPNYINIRDWGIDLPKAQVDGKPLGCSAGPGDQEKRIQRLQWAGEFDKARKEIDLLRERNSEQPFYGDRMLASLLTSQGNTREALQILLPYFEQHKSDFNYLMSLAKTAASAGEMQTAVGSYYRAYKLNPSSKNARKALYQAAFLSYQFQDYDGAGRKFSEFIRRYKKSGLSREAQWHLAWIRYLKLDYEGAYKSFSQILKEKHKSPRLWKMVQTERIQYWMAMCLYRQNHLKEAKQIFLPISQQKDASYYSIAAQTRIDKMAAISVGEKLGSNNEPVTLDSDATEATTVKVSGNETKEENESEEQFAANGDDNTDSDGEVAEEVSDEDAPSAPGSESKVVEGAVVPVQPDPVLTEMDSPKVTDFKDPRLAKRFERARRFLILGFSDWAKWDLYEIERRTSNKSFLRNLMSEYETSGFYNRSAYIGQVQFSGVRLREGIDGVPYIWKFAYPQAYKKSVDIYAKKFKVPNELVWAIMRAESQFKEDVISPVGALGLMQVMPHTGGKVAELLGEKEKYEPQLMLKSDYNIELGTRYLKRLLDKFENKIPLVAASYNAGPHRVMSWLESFGMLDMDEFVEHVPLVETRNYIKKVLSNFYVYHRLYASDENTKNSVKEKDTFVNLSEPIGVKVIEPIAVREIW